RGRGPGPNQVDARVLRGLRAGPPGHADPAVRLTEHERRQVLQRAPDTRAPEDDVGAERGAVAPPHPVLRDLVEHWPALEHAPLAHRLDGRRDGDPRDGDDGARRQASPYPVLDDRDGGPAGLCVEWAL